MSKRFEIFQISFDRGIVENWKQNQMLQEQSVLNSVLWMENYNPNLEYKSLVKRDGILSNVELYFPFVLENYLDDKDYILSKLAHVVHFKTSNPDYNDSYVLFMLDGDLTRPIGYVRFGVDGVKGYWEVNKNSSLPDELDFLKGWVPYGEFRDANRYNENVIFTTSPKTSIANLKLTEPYITAEPEVQVELIRTLLKKLYPCYCYSRFDLTKTREDADQNFLYWNAPVGKEIITDTDLATIANIWEVRTPTLDFIRKANAGIGKIRISETIENELYFLNNDTADNSTSSNFDKDIGLIIWEDSLSYDKYFNRRFTDTTNGPGIASRGTFVSGSARRRALFGDFPVIPCPETFNLEYLNSNHYENVKDIAIHLHSPTTKYPSELSGNIRKYQFLDDNNDSSEIFVTGVLGKDQTSNNTKIYIQCQPFILPDYIKAKLPRPWFKSEKIPFVLTAIKGGNEFILIEDDYTVYYNTIANINNGISRNGNPNVHKFVSGMLTSGTLPDSVVYADDEHVGVDQDKQYTPLATKTVGNEAYHYLVSVSQDHPGYHGDFNPNYIDPDYDGTTRFYWMDDYIVVKFAIRLTEKGLQSLVSQQVTSLKLYAAKPNTEKDGILKSIGYNSKIAVPPGLYSKPDLGENQIVKDYSNYALVKEFIIAGKGTIVTDFNDYDGENSVNSNAWCKLTTDMINERTSRSGNVYYSVPQEQFDEIVGGTFGKVPNEDSVYPVARSVFEEGTGIIESTDSDSKPLTPDFILWDYPLTRPVLSLQFSGNYWEGTGAKLVSVIKGRTFLAGTFDKDGVEEQSYLRFSLVQSGQVSPDIFAKEDFLIVGHLPHTAMLEFREQLIVFNKEQSYRLGMVNAYDSSSWEFLEVTNGDGCLSQKLTCVTPNGFIYGSKNGVFISDGGQPVNLADDVSKGLTVLSLWQKLVCNEPYVYTNYIDPGLPYINTEDFNPYMEINYDMAKSELVISTPVDRTNTAFTEATHEVQLIYSFTKGNWRCNVIPLQKSILEPGTAEYVTHKIIPLSSLGKLKVYNEKVQSFAWRQKSSNPDEPTIDIREEQKNFLVDSFKEPVDGSFGTEPVDHTEQMTEIEARIITHEIGDGKNDYLLHSVIAECVPHDDIISGTEHPYTMYGLQQKVYNNASADVQDPFLGYELRNRDYVTNRYYMKNEDAVNSEEVGYIDLVKLNMLVKQPATPSVNPFRTLLETPVVQGEDSNEKYVDSQGNYDYLAGRESLIMLAPMKTPFRNMRIKFISKMVIKLKSLSFRIVQFRRRSI